MALWFVLFMRANRRLFRNSLVTLSMSIHTYVPIIEDNSRELRCSSNSCDVVVAHIVNNMKVQHVVSGWLVSGMIISHLLIQVAIDIRVRRLGMSKELYPLHPLFSYVQARILLHPSRSPVFISRQMSILTGATRVCIFIYVSATWISLEKAQDRPRHPAGPTTPAHPKCPNGQVCPPPEPPL